MYSIAAVESGFTPAGFYAHEGFRDRILKSKPEVCDNFTVKHYKTYMDCFYNLNFGNKLTGFYMPLYADSPNDMYRWLECICSDFSEAYLLLDEEGREIMLRCHEKWNDKPYIRLTILSDEEKYYDPEQDKCVYNDRVEELYRKTGNTQVIADYMIKKETLIKEFMRETDAYLKSLTRADYGVVHAVRRLAIPHVRKFLKGLNNDIRHL